jgi:hypothetical protein
VGRIVACKCIDRSVEGTLFEIVKECPSHGWAWVAALPSVEDKVNPSHYKQGGLEAIDVIEAFDLDFCRGNAVKYLLRAGRKSSEAEKTELEKARWYIERAIKALG